VAAAQPEAMREERATGEDRAWPVEVGQAGRAETGVSQGARAVQPVAGRAVAVAREGAASSLTPSWLSPTQTATVTSTRMTCLGEPRGLGVEVLS
jgi:hypothetical protein